MKTTTVQLAVKVQTGTDPFGAPIYEEPTEYVDVSGVLVGQPSTDDVTNAIQMYGKRIDYTLGIPKGDTHNWVDTEVIIWGDKYQTVGYPVTGEQENIPLKWGKNVKVTRYG